MKPAQREYWKSVNKARAEAYRGSDTQKRVQAHIAMLKSTDGDPKAAIRQKFYDDPEEMDRRTKAWQEAGEPELDEWEYES